MYAAALPCVLWIHCKCAQYNFLLFNDSNLCVHIIIALCFNDSTVHCKCTQYNFLLFDDSSVNVCSIIALGFVWNRVGGPFHNFMSCVKASDEMANSEEHDQTTKSHLFLIFTDLEE